MIPDENNRPQFQPVRVGLYLGDRTQVLEGLEADQKVFIDLPENSRREEE